MFFSWARRAGLGFGGGALVRCGGMRETPILQGLCGGNVLKIDRSSPGSELSYGMGTHEICYELKLIHFTRLT